MTTEILKSLHSETKAKILETLQNRVLEAIQNNEDLRWDSFLSQMNGYVNCSTGKTYTGFSNCLFLAFTSMTCNGDPRFLTFNQMKKFSGGKGRVLKGSKMTPIFFPVIKDILEEDEHGKEKEKSILTGFRVAYVANVAQTNLIEIGLLSEEWQEKVNQDAEPIQTVMDFVSRIDFQEEVSQGSPYYSPRSDTIGTPSFESFHNSVAFSESILHELIHWTGAENRLNREMTNWTNRQDYSKEELVASLGSSFLLSSLGVDLSHVHLDNQAAYLKNWIQYLDSEGGIECLVAAAADAARATSYLLRMANENEKALVA